MYEKTKRGKGNAANISEKKILLLFWKRRKKQLHEDDE